MYGKKIAIGGKGGVGKTTVCAILSHLFAQDSFDVMAIDADPNTNLAQAFGVPKDKYPIPLINMKELIAERTGTGKDAVGNYFRLNPTVSDLPEKHWFEVSGVKLLVLGAITHAGSGCACPEGAFLKALLRHILLQRKEVIFVDLAAGVEFLGRASIQGIDALLLIVEPGGRSIETANNMALMAQELGIRCVAALANKITDQTQKDFIRSQLEDNITILEYLNNSRLLQDADLKRAPVFGAETEVLPQIKKAKKSLEELIVKTSLINNQKL